MKIGNNVLDIHRISKSKVSIRFCATFTCLRHASTNCAALDSQQEKRKKHTWEKEKVVTCIMNVGWFLLPRNLLQNASHLVFDGVWPQSGKKFSAVCNTCRGCLQQLNQSLLALKRFKVCGQLCALPCCIPCSSDPTLHELVDVRLIRLGQHDLQLASLGRTHENLPWFKTQKKMNMKA